MVVIAIHAAAPPKPVQGAPCNGCGICCLAEPCPLGMLLSRRRHGACRVLEWDDTGSRYACGVLRNPRRHLSWLPASWARKLARRWIAAGIGCDCSAAAVTLEKATG